jgi:predicted Zn-dependent protease
MIMPNLRHALVLAFALAAVGGGAGAQDAPPAPLCDLLAAHPFDPDRFGEGVMFDRIDGERAVSACEEAVAADPNNLRLAYQLGRALARVERTDEAVPQLRRAARYGQTSPPPTTATSRKRASPSPPTSAGNCWC